MQGQISISYFPLIYLNARSDQDKLLSINISQCKVRSAEAIFHSETIISFLLPAIWCGCKKLLYPLFIETFFNIHFELAECMKLFTIQLKQ